MSLFKSIFSLLAITLATSLAHASDVALPLTKDSAAKLIQQQTNGKILSVDKNQRNNKTVFRVKVLHDQGKVKMYRLDAKTGRKLKTKAD